MARRHSGMFKPGNSGNPTGRPKMDKTIRELACAHTKEAILTLAEIAKNPKSSDSARVQACNALLDRGWGKPAQYVETANVSLTIDDILNQVSVKDDRGIIDDEKT
jgi:Family of unknown function (DUF5681)